MRIRQIRNATLVIDYAGIRLLVDPWLEEKGTGMLARSPWPENNEHRSPLVDLPCPVEEVLAGVDAVVASHMEAVNHGNVSRAYLRTFCDRLGVGEQVLIPADGEALEF